MLNIDYIKSDRLLKSLGIGITSDSSLVRVVLYKDDNITGEEGIDISSLLVSAPKVNDTTTLDVPISLIGSTEGLWRVDVYSDTDKASLAYTDLSDFQECILKKLMSLSIEGCTVQKDKCNECADNVLYAHSILTTIPKAMAHGLYEEAVLLKKQLQELCSECTTTSEYQSNCGCR